jgi:superfamily II DNA or RNA helicase
MINLELNANKKQGQILGDQIEFSHLREYFSIPYQSFSRNKKFIPQRKYAITQSGKFEIGILNEMLKFLIDNNYEYTISKSLDEKYNIGFKNPIIKDYKNFEYRTHQIKSIENALKLGRGVVVIPTAGGKTLIMCSIIESLRLNLNNPNLKTLVLVPTIQLVEQTASDFMEYGMTNVTKWSGDNKPDPTATTIVAGTQILLSDKTDLSFLNDIKIFLNDECHGTKKSNEINKIFNFINTDYKFGFTGTMPNCKLDCWNIKGKIGPIVYEEKTESLKNNKYISNFKIYILNINHKNAPKFKIDRSNPTLAYNNELDFLINNTNRNKIIVNLSKKLKNNTIIMVDRIDHGLNLLNMFQTETQNTVYFIRGSTEIEERESIRNLMSERNDITVIAVSKIFSTGINIPNLHNIIFATAGKAKIKIMQSIGRALRLHPTKNMAYIFDIADNTIYGKRHLAEREILYMKENYNYEKKEV